MFKYIPNSNCDESEKYINNSISNKSEINEPKLSSTVIEQFLNGDFHISEDTENNIDNMGCNNRINIYELLKNKELNESEEDSISNKQYYKKNNINNNSNKIESFDKNENNINNNDFNIQWENEEILYLSDSEQNSDYNIIYLSDSSFKNNKYIIPNTNKERESINNKNNNLLKNEEFIQFNNEDKDIKFIGIKRRNNKK